MSETAASSGYKLSPKPIQLQQVVEWGKEPCPHPGMVDHSPFGLLVILRRECPECWQSLKEMCDE
uniref:Uncharacterized protein n=1 Tax=viral metagenome TaxID=1070528 RepID=A0A6M3LPD3_9ZZZZ